MSGNSDCVHKFGDGGTLEILRDPDGGNPIYCAYCRSCGKRTPWRLSRSQARKDGNAEQFEAGFQPTFNPDWDMDRRY